MGIYLSVRPTINSKVITDINEDLHITLAYLGKVDAEKVVRSLEGLATVYPSLSFTDPFTASINGFGTWINPKGYVLYASVGEDSGKLLKLRTGLLNLLHRRGFKVDDTYGFVPHMTLQWSDTPVTEFPALSHSIQFSVDNVYVSEKGNHRRIL